MSVGPRREQTRPASRYAKKRGCVSPVDDWPLAAAGREQVVWVWAEAHRSARRRSQAAEGDLQRSCVLSEADAGKHTIPHGNSRFTIVNFSCFLHAIPSRKQKVYHSNFQLFLVDIPPLKNWLCRSANVILMSGDLDLSSRTRQNPCQVVQVRAFTLAFFFNANS